MGEINLRKGFIFSLTGSFTYKQRILLIFFGVVLT